MVTAKFLTEKFLEPWREKRLAALRAKFQAEGHLAGLEEERRRWVEWNRRRLEAEENGLPFDESPPATDPSDGQSIS